MAIKIEKAEEKPLLARKEVTAHMTFAGKSTPSNADVAKAIASELKTDEKLVVMKSIYTAFGSSEADIKAYVYDTEEDLKKIEPKQKKTEEKKEGEESAEAKPAEAPKAEPKKEEAKPAEPKKEEAPAEEKLEPKVPKPRSEASRKKEEKAE